MDATGPTPPVSAGGPPIAPVVRYMTVSDDFRLNATNPRLLDVIGLVYTIHATGNPPYPLLYPQLCVFLALTDCRGQGNGWVVCENEDTGRRLFRSGTHSIVFGN